MKSLLQIKQNQDKCWNKKICSKHDDRQIEERKLTQPTGWSLSKTEKGEGEARQLPPRSSLAHNPQIGRASTEIDDGVNKLLDRRRGGRKSDQGLCASGFAGLLR